MVRLAQKQDFCVLFMELITGASARLHSFLGTVFYSVRFAAADKSKTAPNLAFGRPKVAEPPLERHRRCVPQLCMEPWPRRKALDSKSKVAVLQHGAQVQSLPVPS